MVIDKIGTTFQNAAANLSKKISTPLNSEHNAYVNSRIVYNASLIEDTVSVSRKTKMLQKVSKKASSDWHNTNKFKSYLLNNSEKVAKGALVAIAGVSLLTGIKLMSGALFNNDKTSSQENK